MAPMLLRGALQLDPKVCEKNLVQLNEAKTCFESHVYIQAYPLFINEKNSCIGTNMVETDLLNSLST